MQRVKGSKFILLHPALRRINKSSCSVFSGERKKSSITTYLDFLVRKLTYYSLCCSLKSFTETSTLINHIEAVQAPGISPTSEGPRSNKIQSSQIKYEESVQQKIMIRWFVGPVSA